MWKFSILSVCQIQIYGNINMGFQKLHYITILPRYIRNTRHDKCDLLKLKVRKTTRIGTTSKKNVILSDIVTIAFDPQPP